MSKKIERAGVIGAGVMGATIAAQLANVGIETVMLDIVPPELTDDDKKSINAYPYDCQVCNLCAAYCQTGSIMVTRDKGLKVPTNWR